MVRHCSGAVNELRRDVPPFARAPNFFCNPTNERSSICPRGTCSRHERKDVNRSRGRGNGRATAFLHGMRHAAGTGQVSFFTTDAVCGDAME